MHSGMGGGAVGRPAGASHWVGVWLVQERISAVSFLGQGGSSVMVTSAKGPLDFLEHLNSHESPCPGRVALRWKNISQKHEQGWDGCCPPLLVKAQSQLLGAVALSGCPSLHPPPGQSFSRRGSSLEGESGA